MTAMVHNVHERELPVPAAEVGRLLDRVGSADDPLWPAGWAPMRFDRPLAVGADGGHGVVRYHVTGYQPGRRLELTFHPVTGLIGTHTLEVEDRGPYACVLRHRLDARPAGRMRLLIHLVLGSTSLQPEGSIELAMLATADHRHVAPVLARVTERRVAYTAGLFVALGWPADEARRRGLLAVTAYLGYAQMAHVAPQALPATEADRRRYVDQVIRLLTASDVDERGNKAPHDGG